MSPWSPYLTYKDSCLDWLTPIPSHWQLKRLKYAASASTDKLTEKPLDLPYVGLEHIESRVGRLLMDTPVEEVDSIVSRFDRGDLLFGKLRPYLAKVAYPDFGGACTSELLVLRPATDVHGRYLFYQLLSEKFIALVTSFTYGAKMPRVSWEQIGNVGVALPPQPEQVAIAAFLDHESAKVDSLVAKKERLIELLREKLLALTGEAVTKGLTRADSTRDSGVRWLGEVPNHWRVVQLRMVIRKFVDYRGATPNKAPSGIPLVTARNIKSGVIDFSESEEFIREEDYASWMVRGLPERGDVLVTTEAPLGESAQVLDETIALAQRIILLKTDRSRLTNAYLKYYLASHAGQAELWSRATGSTALG